MGWVHVIFLEVCNKIPKCYELTVDIFLEGLESSKFLAIVTASARE